jgi:hypothetical protein
VGLHERAEDVRVAGVAVDALEPLVVDEVGEGGRPVAEVVEDGDVGEVLLVEEVLDEDGADVAGAAGNEDFHRTSVMIFTARSIFSSIWNGAFPRNSPQSWIRSALGVAWSAHRAP